MVYFLLWNHKKLPLQLITNKRFILSHTLKSKLCLFHCHKVMLWLKVCQGHHGFYVRLANKSNFIVCNGTRHPLGPFGLSAADKKVWGADVCHFTGFVFCIWLRRSRRASKMFWVTIYSYILSQSLRMNALTMKDQNVGSSTKKLKTNIWFWHTG